MNRKISIAKPIFSIEEITEIQKVFDSAILVSGPKTEAFEKKFADYIGVKNAIAVTNGTTALDVALKTQKIGPGDEVITSAFSFIASSNSILFQNAKPVFADIDPRTFNIDPSDVAEKITNKTKALLPIHLFGQSANMDALNEIAKDNKIALVEDAAQAHGAEYRGRKVGSIGDIACFSFYATKNMTTGEGGIITTNDDNLANKVRLLVNHGQSHKYCHEVLGYNYRMTEFCAAIGLVQLKKLDRFNARRIENAKFLTREINKLRGLTTPYIFTDVKHVFNQYVVRVESNYPQERDELGVYLKKKGIGVAVHYPMPIYNQPLYRKLGYNKARCSNAEDVCKKVLSLPVHPSVCKEDIDYILTVLKDIS